MSQLSTPQPLQGEYGRLVSKTVSTSLEEMFGKSTAKFIEYQMQRAEPSLAQDDDSSFDAAAFDRAGKELFGNEGSLIIKSAIIKKVCLALRFGPEELENEDFVEALDRLKRSYC